MPSSMFVKGISIFLYTLLFVDQRHSQIVTAVLKYNLKQKPTKGVQPWSMRSLVSFIHSVTWLWQALYNNGVINSGSPPASSPSHRDPGWYPKGCHLDLFNIIRQFTSNFVKPIYFWKNKTEF